jgi:hypothetical protein
MKKVEAHSQITSRRKLVLAEHISVVGSQPAGARGRNSCVLGRQEAFVAVVEAADCCALVAVSARAFR